MKQELVQEYKDPTQLKESDTIRNWVLQIITWVTLAGAIIATFFKLYPIWFIFGFIYIAYLINASCSMVNSYLSNKQQNDTIYSIMKEYFLSAPTITMKVECFHHTRRGKGSSNRVVTHRENKPFVYYSSRDVSGLFLLDFDKANLKDKAYIQLEVKKEINFADAISYSDYMVQKNDIWNRNRYLDKKMSYFEERTFQNYKQYHLVKIDGKESSAILSLKAYWISHILTFGQLYITLVNSLCVKQSFTVRKIVSTRFNLMETTTNYDNISPAINMNNQMFNFDRNQTIKVYDSYKINLPSQEEITKANEMYSSSIPNYTSTKGKGDINVVNDLHGFQEDYNRPPPAFTSVGGDVELGDNQIVGKPHLENENEMNMPNNESGISSTQMMGQ